MPMLKKRCTGPRQYPETRHPLVAEGGSYKDAAKELRSQSYLQQFDWTKETPKYQEHGM